ncbi:Zinc finger matrin-type protein 2 [Smittium culicis]|uniref:Zinc finger matrin-type protein 2 n=1 Tax=Smittium culicis TaxID=133412 RepID=A0A1R1Y9R9_9FUNG|nr:Zinc finger matrin-type protein 2 [Smittium culicis]OMJ23396.1 Zinc finger matrin-type protein 2 [Smittium culicis]
MSENKGYYKSDKNETSFRRTWDKEEYEKRARERSRRLKTGEDDSGSNSDNDPKSANSKKRRGKDDQPDAEKKVKKDLETLKAREARVNLSGMLGKVQVVQSSSIAAKQPGYYCKTCDVTIKDSISYLDHINGKKHLEKLNMSLKTNRDSISDVRAKLAAMKKKISEKQTKPEYDFETSINNTKLENELKLAKKKKRLQELKKLSPKNAQTENAEQNEISSIMG